MDEPTSALSPREVGTLFRVIRELSARGVGIVYISHRLQELLEVADSVTILRDGRLVDSAPAAEMSLDRIVSRMTGRSGPLRSGPSEAAAVAPVVLEARNLTLAARPGRVSLRGITFDLRAGELLGVYGAMGAGRTELLESIVGVHADAGGSLTLGSTRLDGLGVAQRVSAGLAFVPEDRQAAGLVPTLSVERNMSLSSLHLLGVAGWVSTSRERSAAARWAADLKVKAPALDAPVTSLSGGNQQKVIIARGLMRRPRVLLMDEPTRGVDVAARADIVDCMRRIAATGVAVMFSSSDLDELLAAATRVLVLSRGWLTEEFASRDATEAAVAAAASRGPIPGTGITDAAH
jgi:erythritol transport system ATP-binding protein